MKFLWLLTFVGSFIGGLMNLFALFGSNTAPQEAAGAAMAVACAVIPYCMARSVAEMDKLN